MTKVRYLGWTGHLTPGWQHLREKHPKCTKPLVVLSLPTPTMPSIPSSVKPKVYPHGCPECDSRFKTEEGMEAVCFQPCTQRSPADSVSALRCKTPFRVSRVRYRVYDGGLEEEGHLFNPSLSRDDRIHLDLQHRNVKHRFKCPDCTECFTTESTMKQVRLFPGFPTLQIHLQTFFSTAK